MLNQSFKVIVFQEEYFVKLSISFSVCAVQLCTYGFKTFGCRVWVFKNNENCMLATSAAIATNSI
jgi:hypothetical protein